MALAPGQPAPTFAVRDQHGTEQTLEGLLAEGPVALVFYPFTFTGVCEGELCQLRDGHAEFDAAGVRVVAVSCDSVPAQKRWSDEMGWSFPVLSDFWPHGAVARAYEVFNEAVGCANRATFLIGRDGIIVDAFGTDDLGTAREASRYTEALGRL